MVKRTDYTAAAATAAKSVLVELAHLLGEYREDIVLIGGWVPEFLIQGAKEPHVGSMDIDIALNHLTLDESGYASIGKLLLDRGYVEGGQPFIYFREFIVEGIQFRVQVDLLAGEYQGTSKGHRTQRIQDIKARKARGCDLAFQMFEMVKVEGKLPDGALDSAEIKVASIVPFLVMKGMALHDRLKEKDAWDVYYCLRNYPDGLDGIVEKFSDQIDNELVKEGLAKLADKFASTEHIGPKSVADFEEVIDEDAREYLKRDAYERVHYLLERLGINNE
jgi:hypothetical protein